MKIERGASANAFANAVDRATINTVPLRLAALTTITTSATAGVIAWYWRLQIGDDCSLLVASLVALATALIALPCWSQSSHLSENLAASLALVLPLSLLAFMCLAGHFVAASVLAYFVIVATCLLILRSVISGLSLKQSLVALLLGISLGVLYFFVINRVGTSSVFAPEAALVGHGQLDSLYHASLAALFAKFGVLTTGLDGFVPLRYHAFSHLIIGHTAMWLNVPAIKVYALMMLVLGAPLLLFSMALAVFTLWRPAGDVRSPIALLLVPLAVFSLFELTDWLSYLASESYLLALVIFFLSFPWLRALAEARTRSALMALSPLAIVVLPVLVFTKVSVGLVFFCALAAFVGLRLLERKLFWTVAACGLVLAAGLLFFLWVAPHPQDSSFAAFKFFKNYHSIAVLNVSSAAAGVAVLCFFARRDSAGLPMVLAFAALATIYPALAINVVGGAEYYFVNIGVWIAIISVSGYVLLPILAVSRSAIPGFVVLSVFVVATVASAEKRKSPASFFKYVQTIAAAGGAPVEADKAAVSSLSAALAGLHELKAQLNDNAARLMLDRVSQRLGSDRRHVAVFVSPRAQRFWHLQDQCRADGFLIPAFLGVPLVAGVPATCDNLADYGFSDYDKTSKNRDLDDEQLCRSGRNISLIRVIRVDADGPVREISCPALQPSH